MYKQQHRHAVTFLCWWFCIPLLCLRMLLVPSWGGTCSPGEPSWVSGAGQGPAACSQDKRAAKSLERAPCRQGDWADSPAISDVVFFWCCFNLSSLAGEPSKGKFPARGTEHTSEGYWEFWVAIREARNKFLINISMAQIEGKKIKLEITSWFPHLNSDLWFLCQDYPWHQSNCEWDNVITDDRDNHWLIFHDLIEIRCCHGLFHDSNGCKVALPTSGSALAAVIELLQNRTSCSLILASSHQAKGAVKSCKSRNTSRWVTEFLPLDLSGAKFELSHPHKHSSVRKMNSLKFCKAASSFPRSNPTNHQPVQGFAKVGTVGGVW